jgi:hypothetical protein
MRPPAAVALAGLLALGACKAAPDLAALATGGAAGAATGSPAVGYIVGLSVRAATAEGLRYVVRIRARAEQDAIADVAGTLPEGGAAPWRIRHDIPIGNENGVVRVTRNVVTPLAECREILFSVEDPPAPPAWFSSSICKQTQQWKWAAAEPAVERWGYLQ